MPLYALKGITYFLGHPALWKQAALPLLLTIMFAIASVFVLFVWTLGPQEGWFNDKGVPSVLAWILAIFLVLAEVFAATLVWGFLCLDFFKDKIFSFVLVDHGLGAMLEKEGQRSAAVRVCLSFLRLDMLMHVVLLIISLPLNLIPIIGSLLFAWIHGTAMAWEAHLFYFDLKDMDFSAQKHWISQRKLAYSSFGMQALLLTMIPLVGPLFIFSNTCGAALLAVKMENETGDDEEAPLAGKKDYGTV